MAKNGILDTLLYGVSLPERATRSLSAVVGGLVNETAARLIPIAFRSSRSYTTFIGQSLDLLIHDVGGVKVADDAVPPIETTLAQKAVGGLLDVAGGAVLHLSPIAVLAIFNDVAYGSNAYLKQLADELRSEGIIDDSSTINRVSDLIDCLAKASDRANDAAAVPPMDVAGMRETVRQIQGEIAAANPTQILPQSELIRIWDDMREVADSSQFGLWQVGTTMTLHTMNRIDLVTRGTLSSIRVAGSLMDEHLFDHYAEALVAIHNDGIYETISKSSAPYIGAVWDNFSSERETWTADLLTGKWFGQAWDMMTGGNDEVDETKKPRIADEQ